MGFGPRVTPFGAETGSDHPISRCHPGELTADATVRSRTDVRPH